MEGFEALPPAESWLAIQDSLQQAGTMPSTDGLVSKISTIVKTASVTTKIAALSILGLVTVGSILFLGSNQKPEALSVPQNAKSPTNEIQVTEQPVEEKKVAIENEKQESLGTFKINSSKAQSLPSKQENSSLINQANTENSLGAETSENELNQPMKASTSQAPAAGEAPRPVEETRQQVFHKSEKADGKKVEKEVTHLKPVIYDVITPNGDGSNDVWIVSFDEPLASYYLRIYNNKGEVVFETHSAQEHWHGLHFKSGELCQEGRYIFELHYKYPNSLEPHQERGFINLIR
jgi:gliding motility-associated-like protein